MKKIIILQFALLLIFSPMSSILADGEATTEQRKSNSIVENSTDTTIRTDTTDSNETKITATNKYFDLVLIRKNQSGFNKAC